MKLVQYDGAILLEPDEPEPELIEIDLEDGDSVEPRRLESVQPGDPKVRLYNVDGAVWDEGNGVWVRPPNEITLD